MIFVIFLLSFALYASESAELGEFWIHYKADVSIGEVQATLNRHRLVAQEIQSNPFRARVVKSLSSVLKQKLQQDIYVAKVSYDNVPLFPDHYYSAFGWSQKSRDRWALGWTLAVPTIIIVFGSSAWDWGKMDCIWDSQMRDCLIKTLNIGGADKIGLILERLFLILLLILAWCGPPDRLPNIGFRPMLPTRSRGMNSSSSA